jgi:hypothetical protein
MEKESGASGASPSGFLLPGCGWPSAIWTTDSDGWAAFTGGAFKNGKDRSVPISTKKNPAQTQIGSKTPEC